MTCSWEGDNRCEHPSMRELASLRAHIEAHEGDLVEAVDAWVAQKVNAWCDGARADARSRYDALEKDRDQARAEVERLRGLLRRALPDPNRSDETTRLRRDIEEALRG